MCKHRRDSIASIASMLLSLLFLLGLLRQLFPQPSSSISRDAIAALWLCLLPAIIAAFLSSFTPDSLRLTPLFFRSSRCHRGIVALFVTRDTIVAFLSSFTPDPIRLTSSPLLPFPAIPSRHYGFVCYPRHYRGFSFFFYAGSDPAHSLPSSSFSRDAIAALRLCLLPRYYRGSSFFFYAGSVRLTSSPLLPFPAMPSGLTNPRYYLRRHTHLSPCSPIGGKISYPFFPVNYLVKSLIFSLDMP